MKSSPIPTNAERVLPAPPTNAAPVSGAPTTRPASNPTKLPPRMFDPAGKDSRLIVNEPS
jgi:hypothetical protein